MRRMYHRWRKELWDEFQENASVSNSWPVGRSCSSLFPSGNDLWITQWYSHITVHDTDTTIDCEYHGTGRIQNTLEPTLLLMMSILPLYFCNFVSTKLDILSSYQPIEQVPKIWSADLEVLYGEIEKGKSVQFNLLNINSSNVESFSSLKRAKWHCFSE